MPACAFLSRCGPSQSFRFISVSSSSVPIELVVGNTAGTQPLPARRILFHEARRHESCRALFWWIALLRSRGLLFRRHKHSYFERGNRQKFFVDQTRPRHVSV